MIFNSAEFVLFFLPVTVAIWWGLRYCGLQVPAQWFLCAASTLFYGWWNWAFLPLLWGSVVINYALGKQISLRHNRPLLIAGISFNLGLLAYFKYADFLIGTINEVADSSIALLHVVLPLGISFFTFQKIAFLVDCWRGQVKSFVFRHFAVFVFFFPQLVAGPITHHGDFIPQLRKPMGFCPEMFSRGLLLFFLGLFKKIWIADTLAKYVDPLFQTTTDLQFFEAWFAALGYSLQLFVDFSAYSEMAIGMGMLFGLRLPQNFNSPYKAVHIADFWRRWHITLSTFLRDYLYIPLGGNRNGLLMGMLAASFTMLLGGLWHGANWTFVVWGALHAGYLCLYRLWRRQDAIRLPDSVAVALTFLAVVVAWVAFRAPTLAAAGTIWQGMLGLNGVTYPKLFVVMGLASGAGTPLMTGLELLPLPFCLYWVFSRPGAIEVMDNALSNRRTLTGVAGLMFLCIFWLNDTSTFLYWNF